MNVYIYIFCNGKNTSSQQTPECLYELYSYVFVTGHKYINYPHIETMFAITTGKVKMTRKQKTVNANE